MTCRENERVNDKKDKFLGIVLKNQRILYTTEYLPLLQLKGHICGIDLVGVREHRFISF